MTKAEYIDIVMSKPPGPECDFIEVENDTGHSINAGEWLRRDDGYWVLRIYPKVFS